jgi:hypothetical protein
MSRMAPSGSTRARTTGLVARAMAFWTLSWGCRARRSEKRVAHRDSTAGGTGDTELGGLQGKEQGQTDQVWLARKKHIMIKSAHSFEKGICESCRAYRELIGREERLQAMEGCPSDKAEVQLCQRHTTAASVAGLATMNRVRTIKDQLQMS